MTIESNFKCFICAYPHGYVVDTTTGGIRIHLDDESKGRMIVVRSKKNKLGGTVMAAAGSIPGFPGKMLGQMLLDHEPSTKGIFVGSPKTWGSLAETVAFINHIHVETKGIPYVRVHVVSSDYHIPRLMVAWNWLMPQKGWDVQFHSVPMPDSPSRKLEWLKSIWMAFRLALFYSKPLDS